MFGSFLTVVFGVFVASVVRGFTGFGFGLASVPLLSIALPPARVVPFVAILQVLVGLGGLPGAVRLTKWRALLGLAPGLLLGMPLGLLVLTRFRPNNARLVIGILIAASVFALWRRVRLPPHPSNKLALGVGVLSGAMNGVAAMGGAPVVVYLLALELEPAIVRATSIVWFLFSSLVTSGTMTARGLVDSEILLWSATSVPVLFVGTWLGSWGFRRSRPHHHRIAALGLLSVIAATLIIRSLLD